MIFSDSEDGVSPVADDTTSVLITDAVESGELVDGTVKSPVIEPLDVSSIIVEETDAALASETVTIEVVDAVSGELAMFVEVSDNTDVVLTSSVEIMPAVFSSLVVSVIVGVVISAKVESLDTTDDSTLGNIDVASSLLLIAELSGIPVLLSAEKETKRNCW